MTNIAYVSNADSGSISVIALDDSGRPTTRQTLALGGTLMPMALAPDKRVLYVARRSDPPALLALRIDAAAGTLAAFAEAPLPASMAHIATDRSGRWWFAASYGDGLVAHGPIDVDGVPGPAAQVRPTGPKAHAMLADPSNRHVFAAVLGADQVLQFRFDAAAGQLTPNDPPALAGRAGAGPRHLAFHPSGAFVYLLNELDASLDVLALDAAGRLAPRQSASLLPPGFAGEPWAAELRLSPDARLLYASERRSSAIAAFRVEDGGGWLRLLGHTSVQAQPRGFAITPDGRFLVVAGQASHRAGVHAIAAESGALAPPREIEVGRNPTWVECLALDGFLRGPDADDRTRMA